MRVEVKRIHLFDSDSSLKAFVDVVLGDKVVVRGCRVVQGNNGLFVSFPQTKSKDKYYSVVGLTNEDDFKSFQSTVLDAYNVETGQAVSDTSDGGSESADDLFLTDSNKNSEDVVF